MYSRETQQEDTDHRNLGGRRHLQPEEDHERQDDHSNIGQDGQAGYDYVEGDVNAARCGLRYRVPVRGDGQALFLFSAK